MRVVVDTGPLVSASHRDDRAHALAVALIRRIGRDLVIPLPVLVEVDHLIRQRTGDEPARRLLRHVANGAYVVDHLTPALLRRAAEVDERYAALGLGFTDAAVMAVAEQRHAPILTFDFRDFRATESRHGPWRLVVDEDRAEGWLDS